MKVGVRHSSSEIEPRGPNNKCSQTHYGNNPASKTYSSHHNKANKHDDAHFRRSGYSGMGRQEGNQQVRKQFENTSRILEGINFSHHDPNLCVCSDCLCGRHLCKLHAVKPDFPMRSTYRREFTKKGVKPEGIAKSLDNGKFMGPNLDMKTMYGSKFIAEPREQPERRKKPEDNIPLGGEFCSLTSYASQFPGFRGPNQYIRSKNSDPVPTLPFEARTTYGKSFSSSKPPKREVSAKKQDNLKVGTGFLGNSTYRDIFKQPNPEDYRPLAKAIEKQLKKIGSGHEYETTYRKEFVKSNVSSVCPAKVLLESKLKGSLSGTKSRFGENADFKSLSPEFHAISTSKHSYV